MAGSYNLTEPNWHPSSLLMHYSDAPGPVRTGSGFYDRSLSSRKYALAGVVFCIIIGSLFIIAGSVITAIRGSHYGAAPIMCQADSSSTNFRKPLEIITFGITLIVTLCTESTGFVHGILLRSALASESRLRFNTNLRLLTAAGGWRHPNGPLFNGIMAVLLILSYVSATLIVTPTPLDDELCIAIVGVPLLFLGIALLLQAAVTLLGVCTVKVLTWSSSPFDMTAALVHHAQLAPVSSRCMRCVSDRGMSWGPARPSKTQPSAWKAHSSIRKVVLFLWGLVIACFAWSGLTKYLLIRNPSQAVHTSLGGVGYKVSSLGILPCFIRVLIQGPFTLALHCTELIFNVIQDEVRWRCASTKQGLKTEMGLLKSFFTNYSNYALLIFKPSIHWYFTVSLTLSGVINGESAVPLYSLTMDYNEIFGLGIMFFILTCYATLFAIVSFRGPQPVAYGHLQTLANLVDEWSPVMWWGHKEDGIPYCHAGTSDHPLPAVKMDCVYAGYPINSASK